jgi:gamma-glutamylcyclotransferase (GGCT)/AIG2-like uncharacterized protein YtfP
VTPMRRKHPAPRTKLFVYGSLMEGLSAHHLVASSPRAVKLGRGRMRGRLLDLGDYPGAVLDRGESWIQGELWELPTGSLRKLDAYEGYFPRDLERSLFVRRRASVHLEEQEIDAWTYLLSRRPSRVASVPDGQWRGPLVR